MSHNLQNDMSLHAVQLTRLGTSVRLFTQSILRPVVGSPLASRQALIALLKYMGDVVL